MPSTPRPNLVTWLPPVQKLALKVYAVQQQNPMGALISEALWLTYGLPRNEHDVPPPATGADW